MPVERYEGVHLGTTPEEIEDEVERGVLLTTMDRAIGWAALPRSAHCAVPATQGH